MAKKRKKRHRFQRASKPGSPPGTIMTSEKGRATVRVMAYTSDKLHTVADARLDDVAQLASEYEVVWIDIVGLGDAKLLMQLGETFHLHSLSLEDAVNVHQRAKFDPYDGFGYYVTRMFRNRLESEQLSIFHVKKFLITIQEYDGDCLDVLRKRIEHNGGLIRHRKSDYLLYAIIDSVLDHYFPIIDEYADMLEAIDVRLVDDRGQVSLHEIHRIRSGLVDLRRWAKPHREMVAQILRDDVADMTPETLVYMRDCYDHIIQLNDATDRCLETCSSLRDYHFNAVSNKTNEVMKTLTIISTIFIPLSFVAGVYGMNFQHMPGIDAQNGFVTLLLIMLVIGAALMTWFHRRGWFT